MKRQGRGSIINIASIYGVVSNDPALYAGTPMVQPPTYNFVKAGMINFTRYLACYYGRKRHPGQLHQPRRLFQQAAAGVRRAVSKTACRWGG